VILLQKLQPIVAISLAAIVLKEQIQKQFIIWAIICLIGGLLVSSPDIGRFYHLMVTNFGSVTSDVATRGYMLVGVSILCWGSTTVFGKRLTMLGYETKSIMGGRFLIGFLTLIPFVKWDRHLILPYGEDYIKIAVMVLISGALAMWFYYRGLKRINAKTAAIAEMFFPFFAIVVNWIFLGKQLTELQLLGGAILIFGSLVIQIKKY
jgi:drug/metabolite transporter (DMT)-like permease